MASRAGNRQYSVDRVLRPARAASVTVLVVAEDTSFGEECGRVLEEDGFAVMHARHSGHALLACLSGRPTDILIAELSMGDGSGPALAERLKRHSPNLRSLFLAPAGTSGHEDGNVLVRPFTGADLLDRVYGCLISSRQAS
jgi:DNA-binding response OmpR family regulator